MGETEKITLGPKQCQWLSHNWSIQKPNLVPFVIKLVTQLTVITTCFPRD